MNNIQLRSPWAGVQPMEANTKEANTVNERPPATMATFTSIDAKNKVWGVSWESSTLGPVPEPGTEIIVTKKDQTTKPVKVGAVHKQYGTRYVLTLAGAKPKEMTIRKPAPKQPAPAFAAATSNAPASAPASTALPPPVQADADFDISFEEF